MAQLSSYQRSKSKKCRTIWHWNVHCISIRPKLAAHTQCFTQKVATITFYTGPNERFINILGQLIRKYGLLETFVIRHKFVFQKQLFWWKHLYSEFRYFPFILKPWNCLKRRLHMKKKLNWDNYVSSKQVDFTEFLPFFSHLKNISWNRMKQLTFKCDSFAWILVSRNFGNTQKWE